jgi:hypothetical protein
MSHRVWHRWASLLVLSMGIVVPAEPTPNPGPPPDPCAPDSTVSIEDYVMWDSVEGGTAEVPVYAKVPCLHARLISFSTRDGTARAGADYVAVQRGTFVFPAGTVRTTVPVKILGYDLPEPPEYFGIRLLSGAKFDDPDAVVTIVDR